MNYEDNPKSIKYYVKKFILENKESFAGKVVIDTPAGTGVTSKILQGVGAKVYAYDLFPEYFKVDGLVCERADIMAGLPVATSFADALICQEGIEHFSDQFQTLKEFNRVLKKNGSLLITTPNYSNLQSRLSYFLAESEYFNKIMPPNELDSIWMSDQSISKEIYFGHIFLIGIQKLRVLAKLAGFRIKNVIFTRTKTTSLLILPFAYPFIILSNWLAYRKNIKKQSSIPIEIRKKIYTEIRSLNTNPRILIDGHIFIEFEKELEFDEVTNNLYSQHKNFDVIT
jgi:SAM-dependent methyltransferase